MDKGKVFATVKVLEMGEVKNRVLILRKNVQENHGDGVDLYLKLTQF